MRVCSEQGCFELAMNGRCPDHPVRRARNEHTDVTTSRRTTPLPPGWTLTRQRILVRDGHTCCACGAPATHCDHVIPAAQGGDDTDENLQALCARCHQKKTAHEANAARNKK
jgi:5-methylcytosine-specific restriction enzyme A